MFNFKLRISSIQLALVLGMSSATLVFAEAPSLSDLVPEFSDQQKKELGKSFGLYTSALTVFTGINNASGGSFKLTPEGEDKTEISILRIPLSHTFGEKNDTFRPVIHGAYGHFSERTSIKGFSDFITQNEDKLPPELLDLPHAPDFGKDESTSISIGGGVAVKALEGLTITPSFDLIWTHIKRQFDYHNFLSSFFGAKYDRDLFNTSIEALSYSPGVRIEYSVVGVDGVRLTPSLDYTHLWTDDRWSKSEFGSFTNDSGVLRSTLELEIPTPAEAFSMPLAVRPYIVRTDLYESAKEAIGLGHYYDSGVDLVFKIPADSLLVSKLKVGGAYIWGEDLTGYRVGVGAEF